MKKILIISDSHSGGIVKLVKNSDQYKKKTTFAPIYKNHRSYLMESIASGLELDVIGLLGRTGYNFSNHLDLLKKDYSEHNMIFFMGYNDLLMLNDNNIKKTAYKYVTKASEIFDKNNKTFISPLKRRHLIEQDPIHINYYKQYLFYIKKACDEINVKYINSYELIGNITDQDYVDDDHLKSYKYLPLLDYALNLDHS